MTSNFPSNNNDIEDTYRLLRLIRRTEEEVARLYPTDKIKSPVHLSIGQEFVSVGATSALTDDDIVSATYRGHAAYLAKGGDLKKMMAELFGKADGCAGGKAGSMHLVDMEHNILGMSAVVATVIPIAVGYALALKKENKGRMVVSFFGDGATEEGVFMESLNFSSLHKLPILFVCENNGYAIHARLNERWANNKLCARVETYDIPSYSVDDGNIFTLQNLVKDVSADIHNGQGPAFIECMTYRWREHVGPNEDYDDGYRDRAELEPWLQNDQLVKVGKLLDENQRKEIDNAVETEIAEAIDFAENSPWPEIDKLYDHVFAE